MRVLTALVAALLLLASPGVSAPVVLPAPAADAVRMVIAVNMAREEFLRLGTAFHTGGGVFYTNGHIVRLPRPKGFDRLYLAGRTATREASSWIGPARVACVHHLWVPPRTPDDEPTAFDVATIVVDRAAGLPTLPLASTAPRVGQRVQVAGFPGASSAWPPILYVARGSISAIDVSEDVEVIDIESGFALEGSSGSPVLNDRGAVVGIVFARRGERGTGAADRVFAVHLEAMKAVCR